MIVRGSRSTNLGRWRVETARAAQHQALCLGIIERENPCSSKEGGFNHWVIFKHSGKHAFAPRGNRQDPAAVPARTNAEGKGPQREWGGGTTSVQNSTACRPRVAWTYVFRL